MAKNFEFEGFENDEMSKAFREFDKKSLFTGGADPQLDRAVAATEKEVSRLQDMIKGSAIPDPHLVQELDDQKHLKAFLTKDDISFSSIPESARALASSDIKAIAVDRDPRNLMRIKDADANLSLRALDGAKKADLPVADRLGIINAIKKDVFRAPKVMAAALEQVDPRKIIRGAPVHGTNATTVIAMTEKNPIALSTALRGISETMEKHGAPHEERQSVINSLFADKETRFGGVAKLKEIALSCVKANPASYPTLAKHSDVLKSDPALAVMSVAGSWKNLPLVDRPLMRLIPPTAIEKAMMGAIQNQNPELADHQRRTLQIGIVGKGFDTKNPAFQEALSSNPSMKPVVEFFEGQRKSLLEARAAKASTASESQKSSLSEAPTRKVESTGRFSSPPVIERRDEGVKVQKQVLSMRMG